MKILSLCDITGNMVKPWVEAGHECTIVDLQHPSGVSVREGITCVGMDIRDFCSRNDFDLVFGFPPCTHLAGSGARWWAEKGLTSLIEGLSLVNECLRIIDESQCSGWMIENPVGRLSSCWREPDYTFNPCDYGGYLDPNGDAYTKRTCLWAGGNFVMPRPKPVHPSEGSKMHLIPQGPDRANLRSATPMGFARAVFEANQNITRPLIITGAKA